METNTRSTHAAADDVVDALEARGRELMGVLNAATAGLIAVIADALVTEAWRGWGIHSPEHWVTLRFGIGSWRAKRLVTAARALAVLPSCRQAFATGQLSEDHIGAIVAAEVQPINDREVAELALSCTVGQLRRALVGLHQPAPDTPDGENGEHGDGGADPPAAPPTYVSRTYRNDGTYALSAALDAADGAVIDKALDVAIDRLFRARYGPHADPALRANTTTVDALRYVAQLALEAMDPATATNADRMPSERYLVNIHVDRGGARVHLGPALPAAVRDELACDALVRTWVTDEHGNTNLGRTRRTVSPKQRTVVERRDGGCIVPGCPATRGLHIHHLVSWLAGGSTDTANLVALCRAHHRQLHQGELHIGGNPDLGTVTITDAAGRPLAHTPPAPVARPLADAAHAAGLPTPQWANRSGERLHLDCVCFTDPGERREPPG